MNAREGHSIILSLPLPQISPLSLPLSLSDSPSGHTINCRPRPSLPGPPLLFPRLPPPVARVTDVEGGNTERGREGVQVEQYKDLQSMALLASLGTI